MANPVKCESGDPDYMSAPRIAKALGISANMVMRMASIGQVRARTQYISVSLYSLGDVKEELKRRQLTEVVRNPTQQPATAGLSSIQK